MSGKEGEKQSSRRALYRSTQKEGREISKALVTCSHSHHGHSTHAWSTLFSNVLPKHGCEDGTQQWYIQQCPRARHSPSDVNGINAEVFKVLFGHVRIVVPINRMLPRLDVSTVSTVRLVTQAVARELTLVHSYKAHSTHMSTRISTRLSAHGSTHGSTHARIVTHRNVPRRDWLGDTASTKANGEASIDGSEEGLRAGQVLLVTVELSKRTSRVWRGGRGGVWR